MRVLVIGSQSTHVNQAIVLAKKRGARVSISPDPDSALLDLCSGKGADLVLIDVQFRIAEFMQDLKSQHITVPVVAYGIQSDPDKAAASIRAGAEEYIPLPPDEEMIAGLLESIARDDQDSVFSSPKMKLVLAVADKIAPSEANVLITGESGTGKEVMTRYIHSKSKRATAPLISVNCAAIPENLLESELFGHEKGAFTGATYRRIGKFEEAEGGTLQLDEISEMDIRLQAKLLRAIQERVIVRVGGSHPVKLNLRLIATTNRDLKEDVAQGRFREDLFFRLNVITLQLPPLRERTEEILPLTEHFITKYAKINGVDVPLLSDAVRAILLSYPWPGNVRELENTIHRAVLMANRGVIDETSIILEQQSVSPKPALNAPASLQHTASGGQTDAVVGSAAAAYGAVQPQAQTTGVPYIGRTIESVEQEMILSTLQHVGGNRTHAARMLGISIRTLRNKLRQYIDSGITVPGSDKDE